MEHESEMKEILSLLLLLVPKDTFESRKWNATGLLETRNITQDILSGNALKVVQRDEISSILFSDDSYSILKRFPQHPLRDTLELYVKHVLDTFTKEGADIEGELKFQLVAISLLQSFIQLNFTGPSTTWNSNKSLFPDLEEDYVQKESVKLLSIDGQPAYNLMSEPLLIVLALLFFEKGLQIDYHKTLVSRNRDATLEELVDDTKLRLSFWKENTIKSSFFWWRSRALQIHSSLLSEESGTLSAITAVLLNVNIVDAIVPPVQNSDIRRKLQLIFCLESARNAVNSKTEHLAIPFIEKSRQISDLNLVLTGAKAKRTKFQKVHNSALVLLAKSKTDLSSGQGSENKKKSPEVFELNSDLLLERPEFESLDDLELQTEQDTKRIKFDSDYRPDEGMQNVLPICTRAEDIPVELKELNPNEQPVLSDVDYVQLLLRYAILKQTSPYNNPLIEEQLGAIIGRILYTKSTNANWLIFSRALWERSLLETNKARTVERGILQMTSLIEEIGIKIKTRIMPQASDESDELLASSRLRYIHQLPLLPQWTLDMKLAEKYMSLGVLRSAIEIYERLQLPCEAALCYVAVDEEQQAEQILLRRLEEFPDDARAISILGDIKQDPELWLRAWEVGKYPRAKASLSRYYYNPPASSGETRNIGLAIKHMNDSLSINPLNYDNWFFYGCCGLESGQFELASEAFTRCVSIDDMSSHAWSNLATALLKLDKTRPAFSALKNAIRNVGEADTSWKIYENYVIVAAKLGEWNDVLFGVKELVSSRGSRQGEKVVDITMIEKLVQILMETEYPNEPSARLTHYQESCVDLVCNVLPTIITGSARCWRLVSKVELWQRKPWAALECLERAYRALTQKSDLDTNEKTWNEAVESCCDLVAAYESLGELPGRHNAGDLVCKDWKYKARSAIRSLLSKGKATWEDSEGWDKLQALKEELTN